MIENNPQYIDDIINHLSKNLIEASKIDDENIFVEILLLIRDDLILGSISKSVYNYEKLILIPSQIYNYLSLKFKKILIDIFTIRFTENISVINYNNKISIEYIDKTYLGLLYLVKNILNNNDSINFKLLFDNLKQLTDFSFHDRKESLHYHFSFVIISLSWIYYLYQNNKIDIQDYDISYLENTIKNAYSDREYIINTFYSLNENSFNEKLWGIDRWEIERPPVGEAYMALMPHTWLNFGFALILLKFDIVLYHIELEKVKKNELFKFVRNDIKKNIDVVKNSLDKWNIEKIDEKADKILHFYDLLKKREDIIYFSKVAKNPLSIDKINEFKGNVGKLWDKNSIIPTVLKYFNRVTFKKNIYEKDGFGFFRTLLKSRFAFIEGKEYQNIFGLSDFGGKLAREIDFIFFSFINLLKKIFLDFPILAESWQERLILFFLIN